MAQARRAAALPLTLLLAACFPAALTMRVPALVDRVLAQGSSATRSTLQPLFSQHKANAQALQQQQQQQQQSVISQKRSEQRPQQQQQQQVPTIELAARQFLFNYGTQRGLEILRARVKDLKVPDVAKSFNLPLVGDFTLQLSNIQVTQFNASSDEARLTILDGHFDLWVTQVEVQVQFNWHWEKLGMQGTGSGELDLHGGSIDYKFHVAKDEQAGKPLIEVDDVATRFDSVELQIRSFSADWLYQAVMALFNDKIQRAIQNGIAQAMQSDVPEGINKVLRTLPTRLDVTGLPVKVSFEYSVFALTYVMVKGYGMVDTAQLAATRLAAAGAGALVGGDLAPCPFAATPLPLTPESIAADGRMTSIYLHQSLVNCLSWGLFHSNMMQFDLVDGTIPKLHLTTDLLAMLIPLLPKAYPHQLLRITGQALSMPSVSFGSDGVTIEASYRTSIYVANETAGNPKIVTMAANLTIKADLNYDTTIIHSAAVHHTVEEAAMPVSAPQWDNTVAWFISNYAGLYPLQFLIDHFVQTPVTSLVSLVNAEASTYDGWYALSGDVLVHDS